MSEPAGLASYRFSTDALPEHDRVAYWREFFARHVAGIDLEPAEDEPLRLEMSQQSLSRTSVAKAFASAFRGRRTRQQLADGKHGKTLLMPGYRHICARQCGREVVVGEGEAVLLSMNDTFHVEQAGMRGPGPRAHYMHVILPDEALAPLVPELEDSVSKVIPADNEALGLLHNYVRLLSSEDRLVTAYTAQVIASHIQDLSVLAIGGSRDARVEARRRGLGAARLATVQALIRASLGRPGLTLTDVARQSSISPGYVRKLFAARGTSFSDYVLEQRLERARRMLASREFAHLRIGDIAYDCGFGDLSYFNRAFRRRFAATPSDVRSERQAHWHQAALKRDEP